MASIAAFAFGVATAGIGAVFAGIEVFGVATDPAGCEGEDLVLVVVWLQPVRTIANASEMIQDFEKEAFIMFRWKGLEFEGRYDSKADVSGCDARRVTPAVGGTCAISLVVIGTSAQNDGAEILIAGFC